MTISQITDYLETIAPLAYQESYDNSGLLVGRRDTIVTHALLTLDCTEAVVDEAIARGCNLIIAHHPIIFSGLKRLNGSSYIERVVIAAIKHDIAIYAIHTNYDNVPNGVNAILAEKIGLTDCRILKPQKGGLKKLVTYLPSADYDKVTRALFDAGAGHIGHYAETAFSHTGTGQFLGDETTSPAIGQKEVLQKVSETKVETIFPSHLQSQIIAALQAAHPYETPAYDILPLDNTYSQVGAGMIGTLPKSMDEMVFLNSLKINLKAKNIKYTTLRDKPIFSVAVCGGAGQFLLADAILAEADILVTSDFKYHQFFDAEGQIIIADVGHYESEQFTAELLHRQLTEKFPTFAPLLSQTNTNPVNYL
jgi:dinuclear metal center YbgI/SA1388 family protein